MAATLLLSVQDATISFGGKPIFEDLTFHIQEGRKICLVGKNGAGKSTLMNVITGDKDLDLGTRWQLQGTTIGYLQQDIPVVPGQTVADFVFAQLKASSPDLLAHERAHQVEKVITPLQLDPQARMETLSGGQLRRAALARALVEDPDILLLDEPTNHLDLDIIEWLENYLKSWRGTLLVISHDRAFLKTVTDTIFWLDRGRLKVCPKGFAHFEDWSSGLLEQEARELANRQKAVDQELDWARQGVKARRKRNMRRLALMKEARDKLRADKSAFNRMMARIDVPDQDVEMSSRIVAEFIKVTKTFTQDGRETPILENFNLRIQRGDRIGILGRNGSGKTSFLRLLVGELEPDAGKVKLAKDLNFSYFDQRRKDLNPEYSLWRTLCPTGGDYVDVMGKQRHVCGYLKDFLFDPARVRDAVATLSGGQKNRLLLAKVLANPGSFLILDEPTNDLDMDTLDMLEDILTNYRGTLIVVSHDRDFLDQTVTKILAFEGEGRVEGCIGGYSDYLAQRAAARPDADEEQPAPRKAAQTAKKPAPAPQATPPAVQGPGKLSYKLQYELDHLPEEIAALEQEIAALNAQLADPDLYSRDAAAFDRASRRLSAARADLDAKEHRWLELEDMRAGVA